MKKKFVVACSLLLLSATATFAQYNDRHEVRPTGPPPEITVNYSFKMAVNDPMLIGNAGFGGAAKLTLKTNELVMERTTMEGDAGVITVKVWSIPFSSSAKEMEFQADGNLVVRDSGNKVLWASEKSAPHGRLFKVDYTGKLQILTGDGRFVLWEK